jgi:hypothetical protein
MKTILLSLFVLSTANQDIPLGAHLDGGSRFNDFRASCFLFNRSSWQYYDLNPISRPADRADDYYIKTNNTYVYYNFCGETHYQCDPSRKSLLNVKYDNGSCWYLDIPDAKAIKLWNSRRLVFVADPSKAALEIEYLQLTLNSRQKCNSEKNYTLTFAIKCDNSMHVGEYKLAEYSYDSFEMKSICEKYIYLSSRHGCANIPIYSVWRFYMEYSYIFGNCLIVLGFYILLRGISFKRITSVLYGTHTGLIVFFSIMSQLDTIVNDTVMWYCAITSLIIGSTFGYLINKAKRLRNMLIGAWCGYVIATISYYLFFAYISLYLPINPRLFYALLIISTSIACGLTSLCLKENAVYLISNPMCGSCAVLRVFNS